MQLSSLLDISSSNRNPREFEDIFMPDDQTLVTILTICNLLRQEESSVKTAVEAYERAMKDVIAYRRSQGLTEVGGLPQ